jgi:hypothetical protein
VAGLRVALRCGRLAPELPSRRAALFHARLAFSCVPLDAPASRAFQRLAPDEIPPDVPLFASDAAVPGAVAVVQLRPQRRLVHWRVVPPDMHVVHAEAAGLAAAAAAARRARLPAVAFATDASAPFGAALRGRSRSAAMAAMSSHVRAAAPCVYLLRVPSGCNVLADACSRCDSRAGAARLVAADGPGLLPSPLSAAGLVRRFLH